MRGAGMDVGSRTVELVVLENGRVVESQIADSGFEPLAVAQRLLNGSRFDRLVATGYGRHLLEVARDVSAVTEIKAYAVGARFMFPEARTILDIGGQDSKVISLGETGQVKKFEMNDRCAAGSGKFLEIMAHRLGFTFSEFAAAALSAGRKIEISSMCTVFAESEVTSLLHRHGNLGEIARGLHASVAQRALGMLHRVSVTEPLVFAGGVALSSCMRALLEESLEMRLLVPEQPQMVGALGAAVLASRREP